MESENYIKDVLVTKSGDLPAITARLSDPDTLDLLHAVIGMSTEAGELLDMLKKHIWYGRELDLVNLEEELGDLDWYQSLAIHAARMKKYVISWEQIWDKNIAKLQEKRYKKGKFTEEEANNRDLEAERKLLEGAPTEDKTCRTCIILSCTSRKLEDAACPNYIREPSPKQHTYVEYNYEGLLALYNDSKLARFLARKIEEELSENGDPCQDNERLCEIGNREQEREYKYDLAHGCCGFVDVEFVYQGGLLSRILGRKPRRFRYGFNYGH